jgi:hypothetical protein
MTALAAFGACCTARYSSRQAFAKHKRAMQASDMVHEVGNAYQALFERSVSGILDQADWKCLSQAIDLSPSSFTCGPNYLGHLCTFSDPNGHRI